MAPSRGISPTAARILWGLGFIIAIAATVMVLFAQSVHLLRVAVMLALWAALIAAFAMARSRREAHLARQSEEESYRTYRHELQREVSARHQYEADLAIRVSEQHQAQIADLRDQLDRLTDVLTALTEGEFLVSRMTLSAESARFRAGGPAVGASSRSEIGGSATPAVAWAADGDSYAPAEISQPAWKPSLEGSEVEAPILDDAVPNAPFEFLREVETSPDSGVPARGVPDEGMPAGGMPAAAMPAAGIPAEVETPPAVDEVGDDPIPAVSLLGEDWRDGDIPAVDSDSADRTRDADPAPALSDDFAARLSQGALAEPSHDLTGSALPQLSTPTWDEPAPHEPAEHLLDLSVQPASAGIWDHVPAWERADAAPEPRPLPLPEPVTDPHPDPEPVPTDPSPAPVPAREPVPSPVPEPVPAREPVPAPEPVPSPVPEPFPAPEPRPVPVPHPAPVPDPRPIPAPVPEPIPVPDPAPDPTFDPVRFSGDHVAPSIVEALSIPQFDTPAESATEPLETSSAASAARHGVDDPPAVRPALDLASRFTFQPRAKDEPRRSVEPEPAPAAALPADSWHADEVLDRHAAAADGDVYSVGGQPDRPASPGGVPAPRWGRQPEGQDSRPDSTRTPEAGEPTVDDLLAAYGLTGGGRRRRRT